MCWVPQSVGMQTSEVLCDSEGCLVEAGIYQLRYSFLAQERALGQTGNVAQYACLTARYTRRDRSGCVEAYW